MRKSAKFIALAALLCCQGAAVAQSEVFAFDLRFAAQANLFSFETNTPAIQTQIGPVGGLNYSTFAMDFSVDGSTLHALNHLPGANAVQLGVIDTATGVFTASATVTGAGWDTAGTNPTGLSIDPVSGVFYASKTNQLFTINPVTAVATLVGNFVDTSGIQLGTVIDISIDNNGNMFLHVLNNVAGGPGGALWSVDKATGVCTFIGTSGVATNFAQGMDFDPATNILYAALYTGGGNGSYGTWDTSTGAWTEILALASFPDPTPNGRELEIAIRSLSAPCVGDIADDFGTLGADDQVSFGDFLALLGLIGPCPGGSPGCTGDIADDFGTLGGDGQVSFGDFLALLGLIGPCP
jgi:hypothetical protein